MTSDPVLHVLAGPNGAGKSTLYARVVRPQTHLVFVNADELAHEQWPGDESAHAYEASRAAADRRESYFLERRSFATETVFSHSSKVDLVERAVGLGYLVTLHVVAVPVELAVARVVNRMENGGHFVPEQKIRERYERLWPLIRSAIDIADHAVVDDNSTARSAFRTVARFDGGRLVGQPDWPQWIPRPLRD